MPRRTRDHEEHLENIEPVGVVVLNDLCYILQDLSEFILDLGKLLRNRRPEIEGLFEQVKENGPMALAGALPEEFLPFLMETGMELASMGMEMKAEVQADPEDGEEEVTGVGIHVDTDKVQPEQLERAGNTLREKAEALEAMIADFEAQLLADTPLRDSGHREKH